MYTSLNRMLFILLSSRFIYANLLKTVGAADVIIHNSINLAVHLILIEPPGNRSCITKLVKNIRKSRYELCVNM